MIEKGRKDEAREKAMMDVSRRIYTVVAWSARRPVSHTRVRALPDPNVTPASFRAAQRPRLGRRKGEVATVCIEQTVLLQ